MTKRYTNPPLVEALCEFQFDPSTAWDLTLIGLIYDQLKDIFPRREQLQVSLSATVSPEINIQIGTIGTVPLVRFLDNDRKALVQVGQNLLTVNHLQPYTTWENFFPLIEKGFKAYYQTAQPKALQHIGIRYINRINIPRPQIDLANYFRFRPHIPQDLPQEIDSLFMSIGIPLGDTRDILRMQIGTLNPETPDTISLILEIGYVFAKPGEIALHEVLDKVNVAHKHVENAFESCLTDELKLRFGEVIE